MTELLMHCLAIVGCAVVLVLLSVLLAGDVDDE